MRGDRPMLRFFYNPDAEVPPHSRTRSAAGIDLAVSLAVPGRQRFPHNAGLVWQWGSTLEIRMLPFAGVRVLCQ